MGNTWIIPVLASILFLSVFAATDVFAETIYESATLGPPDQFLGITVSVNNIVGSKFSTTQEFEVNEIRTHMRDNRAPNDCATVFGAILEMPGPLPQGRPFTTDEVLATTTFRACFRDSTYLTVPFSVILPPGDYALVFGSGHFGASSRGTTMAFNGVDTPEGAGSYFVWTERRDAFNWIPIKPIQFTGLAFAVFGDPSFCGKPESFYDHVIDGTPGPDRITGSNGNDLIRTFGGNDQIHGFGGDDCIQGGDGNDIISGGDGNDTIEGGLGNDIISGRAGNDKISGNGGDDIISGGDDNDTIDGGDGNDKITGRAGDDTISGGLGNDIISGGLGNDIINGDAGDDQISGREGDDTIDGGADSDLCSGGPDVDTFANCEVENQGA